MRFRPRMGNSRLEGGREELWRARVSRQAREENGLGVPVVSVERLELGKVSVKGRDVSCSDTPERADFENVTCIVDGQHRSDM